MTSARQTNLGAALDYHRRGLLPIPLCWPDEDGKCACGRGHIGNDVGKAPLLAGGYQDLQPTEKDVRQGWTDWPLANIGLLLKPSGLVFVGPDTPGAVEWASNRGLPPTAVRISRNPGYLYLRPQECPIATTKYKDGDIEIDIKANGYCVAYGTHRDGHDIYLDGGDPAPAPAWVVDMLTRRNSHSPTHPPPPVDFRQVGQAVTSLGRLSSGRCDDYNSWVQVGMALSGLGDVGLQLWDLWSQQSQKYRPGECADKWRSFEPGHGLTIGSLVHWGKEDGEAPPKNGQDPENLTSHHKGGPCEVRLREVDATQLISMDAPAVLKSLPLLCQDGYIIEEWGHILSGYPKAGKTELIFRCVYDWLKDSAGPVLWFTEESESVWRYRLAKHPDFPQGLRLIFALGEKPEDLLTRARNGIEQFVIVDTIRNLLGISDECDNALIARTLGPWEAALQRKTRIYAHHDNKAGGEHGKAISGGGAFLGVVDRAIELKFDPHNRKRRQLTVHSRIQEAPDLVYEMGEDRTLHALGDPDQVSLAEVENRAAEVLLDEWRKTGEILEAVGDPKPSEQQLRNALNSLLAAGTVERDPLEIRRGATYRWRLKT